MYRSRVNYAAVRTTYLQNVYWLGDAISGHVPPRFKQASEEATGLQNADTLHHTDMPQLPSSTHRGHENATADADATTTFLQKRRRAIQDGFRPADV
jgi:hypothetical protein